MHRPLRFVTLIFAIRPFPAALALGTPDKTLHVLAFGTLTALGLAAFPSMRSIWLLVLLSLYGALIEVVQAIPWLHRDPELLDWAADTGAILVMLGIAWLLRWLVLSWRDWRARQAAAPDEPP